MTVSLLVPTRGRPDQLASMWASACATASRPNGLELVIYVDDDDPTVLPDLGDATIIHGPRIVLSDCWNKCAVAATGDILWLGNDDVLFRTPGWDEQVTTVFDRVADRIVLVYPDDGIHGGALASLGFIHRRWVDTVGHFTSPLFSCDWADVWLDDVATALGRRTYLPGTLIEHMHPLVGKGPVDQTHQERMARGAGDNVAQLYLDRLGDREEDIRRLRAVMR